jgi:hypothetical protein
MNFLQIKMIFKKNSALILTLNLFRIWGPLQMLYADRLIHLAESQGSKIVIPPKSNMIDIFIKNDI